MNLPKIQKFTKKLRPNWPVPIKFIGGGVNGRVFETNNGRLMKFVLSYAPEEWYFLKKLQGNSRFPVFKSGNSKNIWINRPLGALSKMFNVKSINGLTVFIMGKVGAGHAMTLKKYLRLFPNTNRAPVQERVKNLIDTMHRRGVSHGDLHFENILVTSDSRGRITGMWVIDFGRSRNIPLGKTEKNVFNKLKTQEYFQTENMNNTRSRIPIAVKSGSRPNTEMAKIHYKKAYTPERANKVRTRRLENNTEMKNYKSPKKTTSPRRTQSAPRQRVSLKINRRPRFSPNSNPRASPRRPSSKSASLGRKS